jgi:hypothetical protein
MMDSDSDTGLSKRSQKISKGGYVERTTAQEDRGKATRLESMKLPWQCAK